MVLSSILFHPHIHKNLSFSQKILSIQGQDMILKNFWLRVKKQLSPYFRFVYPIEKHKFEPLKSWDRKIKGAWFRPPKILKLPTDI